MSGNTQPFSSDGGFSTTANVVAGNISTAGSGGNITGANVVSAVTFTATGNVTGSLIEEGVNISIFSLLLLATLVLSWILQVYYRHLPDHQALHAKQELLH